MNVTVEAPAAEVGVNALNSHTLILAYRRLGIPSKPGVSAVAKINLVARGGASPRAPGAYINSNVMLTTATPVSSIAGVAVFGGTNGSI